MISGRCRRKIACNALQEAFKIIPGKAPILQNEKVEGGTEASPRTTDEIIVSISHSQEIRVRFYCVRWSTLAREDERPLLHPLYMRSIVRTTMTIEPTRMPYMRLRRKTRFSSEPCSSSCQSWVMATTAETDARVLCDPSQCMSIWSAGKDIRVSIGTWPSSRSRSTFWRAVSSSL